MTAFVSTSNKFSSASDALITAHQTQQEVWKLFGTIHTEANKLAEAEKEQRNAVELDRSQMKILQSLYQDGIASLTEEVCQAQHKIREQDELHVSICKELVISRRTASEAVALNPLTP